ncbi:MAG: polysaccharide biosynthesis protein [Planctomyces sp.]|nr:polysaccharide biosynthesis protein [Planctomyces sp.]
MPFRQLIIPPIYVAIYGLTYALAFTLRFDFEVASKEWGLCLATLPLVVGAKSLVNLLTRQWRRKHRYTSLVDFVYVTGDAFIAATLLLAMNAFLPSGGTIPRSIVLIDLMLTVLAIAALRTSIRGYCEIIHPRLHRKLGGISHLPARRAIIFGADASAVAILRALKSGSSEYRICAFIDPEGYAQSGIIGEAQVFSGEVDLARVATKVRAELLLIPASTPGRVVRELLVQCHDAGLLAHVIPGIDEIVNGRYRLATREVTISDLLRREPTKLDMDGMRKYISGHRVLVTGAAGSIGSELCRQILALGPEALVLLDQSECGIFSMEQEFLSKATGGTRLDYEVSDIRDGEALAQIFEDHRPQLVFHAAAYKHVPLMESNPQEAIRNNIFGTKTLVDTSDQFGVERFVLISTDKAVRPTNIMGSTKLFAEKYLQAVSQKSKTQFMTVRFGNVLNSAGSVVPTFRRQIQEGGPITVTHPDMVRFFMTIPEAVQLVLQAGAIGTTGGVMILDMGEPVKILDLARDMIYLSGLKYPDDIDIVFKGLRPGEKLYEELFYESEVSAEKIHEKIFLAHRAPISTRLVKESLARLQSAIEQSRTAAAETLRDITAQFVAIDEGQTTETIPAATKKAA